jgi:hypothetical protein
MHPCTTSGCSAVQPAALTHNLKHHMTKCSTPVRFTAALQRRCVSHGTATTVIAAHLENLQALGLDLAQVGANQQGGLEERPQRKVGPLLREAQAAVAHLRSGRMRGPSQRSAMHSSRWQARTKGVDARHPVTQARSGLGDAEENRGGTRASKCTPTEPLAVYAGG